MDVNKIQENIRQREIVDYVYEFVRETIEAEQFKDAERFARLLCERITEKHCRRIEVSRTIMSREEAKTFEEQPMPFGEYKGCPIGTVPLDRLQWYANQQFTDELRRYITSELVQKEKEFEERYAKSNSQQ